MRCLQTMSAFCAGVKCLPRECMDSASGLGHRNPTGATFQFRERPDSPVVGDVEEIFAIRQEPQLAAFLLLNVLSDDDHPVRTLAG